MFLNYFELICRNNDNSANEYYYFTSSRVPRDTKQALTNGYAPDKLRLICEECNITPISIRLIKPYEYLTKKYFLNWYNGFPNGYRINWKHARFITRYQIIFCEKPDRTTKFGEYKQFFATEFAADHCIRMGWEKAIKGKVNDAYQVDDGYLMIEQVNGIEF